MNIGRVLNLVVRAQSGGVESVLMGLSYQLAWMADSASKAHVAMGLLGGALILLGATGVGALRSMINTAIDFDTHMRRIITLTEVFATTGVDGFKDLKQGVIDLARTVPKSITELADSLYFITDTVSDTSAAMEILEVSAKAASLGMANTEDVARAITAAYVAYGGTIQNIHMWTDQLTAAVSVGKGEYGEYAKHMGKLIGFGNALGIEFGELAGMMSILTRRGYSVDEAATSVRNTMMRTIKPAAEAKKMYDKLGITYGSAGIAAAGGFIPYLYQIIDATNGSEEAIADLFPRIRALPTLYALLKDPMNDVAEVMGVIGDSAGTMSERFDIAMMGPANQLALIHNIAEGLRIMIGDSLIPIVLDFAMAMIPVGEALSMWVSANPELVKLFAIIAGGASVFSIIVGIVMVAIAVFGMFSKYIGYVMMATIPLTGLILALAGVVAYLRHEFSMVADNKAARLFEMIGDAARNLWAVLQVVVSDIARAYGVVFGTEGKADTPVFDLLFKLASRAEYATMKLREFMTFDGGGRSKVYQAAKDVFDVLKEIPAALGLVRDGFANMGDASSLDGWAAIAYNLGAALGGARDAVISLVEGINGAGDSSALAGWQLAFYNIGAAIGHVWDMFGIMIDGFRGVGTPSELEGWSEVFYNIGESIRGFVDYLATPAGMGLVAGLAAIALMAPKIILFFMGMTDKLGAFGMIALRIGGGVVGVFTKLASGLIALWQGFVGLQQAGGILTVIKGLFATMAGSISGFLAAAWPVLAVVGAILAIFVFFKAVGVSFADIFNIVKDAVLGVIGTFKFWLIEAGTMGDLIASLKNLWDSLVPILVIVGGVLAGVLAVAIGIVIGLFRALAPVIAGVIRIITGAVNIIAGVIGFIVNFVKLIGGALVALFTGDLTMLQEAARGIGDSIFNIVNGIWQVFSGALTAILGGVIEFVQGVIDWFVNLYKTLVGGSIIPDMINEIVDWFMGLPGRVMTFIRDLVRKAIANFEAWRRGAIDKVSSLVNTVLNWIRGLPGRAVAFIRQLVTQGLARFNELKTSAIRRIAEMVTGVVNKAKEIKTKVYTAIRDAVTRGRRVISNFVSLGKDLISGLIRGIGQMARSAGTAVWNLIKGAFNSGKKAANSSSPSKLFAQLGSWLGEGVVVGMMDTTRDIAIAASGMIPNQVVDEAWMLANGVQAALSTAAAAQSQFSGASSGAAYLQTTQRVEHVVRFEGTLPDGVSITAREVADLLNNDNAAARQVTRLVTRTMNRDER